MEQALLSARPWYRERWPWLLMLGPAIVVVAGFVTLALAIRSDDGLVADDYYKRGLEINRTLTRVARAGALGIAANVDIAPTGVAIVVLESRAPDAEASPEAIRLVLAHPTRADADLTATLRRAAPGRYVGALPPPARQRWQVIVETDHWRLSAREDESLRNVVLRAPRAIDP